jgi:hypothetical protein
VDNALIREARRLGGSVKYHYNEKGAGGLAAEVGDYVWAYASYPFLHRKSETEPLELFGRKIRYVRHYYNRAWKNERSVELGLARDFLAGTPAGRTLEIGNVMSHYGPADYEILDKYEPSPGVINEDIVDYKPDEPFDRVLSISTLEHIGWDERPREPEKVLRANDHMRSLVAPGGAMLVTTALGQNPHLDEYIKVGRLSYPVDVFLRRVSDDNRWEQIGRDEIADAKYHSPYRAGNVLYVGIVPVEGGWPDAPAG